MKIVFKTVKNFSESEENYYRFCNFVDDIVVVVIPTSTSRGFSSRALHLPTTFEPPFLAAFSDIFYVSYDFIVCKVPLCAGKASASLMFNAAVNRLTGLYDFQKFATHLRDFSMGENYDV